MPQEAQANLEFFWARSKKAFVKNVLEICLNFWSIKLRIFESNHKKNSGVLNPKIRKTRGCAGVQP